MAKTEEARGWGVRINCSPALLAYYFYETRPEAEHRCMRLSSGILTPVPVVLLPLAEYRRLKALDKKKG